MPSTYSLTTVARFKSFIKKTTNEDDTLIEILINVVTDFVERFCDRRFLRTTYTNEVYDGLGTDKLLLKQYPVISASAFSLDQRDTPLNENQWSAIDTNLYHIDWNAGIVELIGYRFDEVPRKYRVTYTAGYLFDNSTPGATLESVGIGDLEYVVWVLLNNAYKNATKPMNVKSESIGNYSVSYGDYQLLSPEIKEILNKYKRPHLM